MSVFPSPQHAIPKPPSHAKIYNHELSIKTDYSVGDEFQDSINEDNNPCAHVIPSLAASKFPLSI